MGAACSKYRGLMMKILLVEDDRKIASFVVKGLTEEGYFVRHSSDGEEAFTVLTSEPFDMAIVDIMLPKLDGLSLIEQLRRFQINTPVIILSAKRSLDDRIDGLRKGGDDYITKPFAFSELLVRTQSLIRRARGIAESTKLTVGDLHMDMVTRQVTRGGSELHLQPREFVLLEYLMRNAGRIISRAMIAEHVWNYCFDSQTNVVEARICSLRDKVDKGSKTRLIHTIRGAGYVLREDPKITS
jgi:two-component system, OmpR family, response regulator